MKPAEGDAGRTRTGDLAAYWWVFPNFMLNLYAGVMDTNLVLPLGRGPLPGRLRLLLRGTAADADFMRESVRGGGPGAGGRRGHLRGGAARA